MEGSSPQAGRPRALATAAYVRVRSLARELVSRETPRRRRVLLATGFLASIAGILGVLVFLYALVLIPFTPGISDIRKAKTERPTVVISSDGETLAEFKPVNREWAELEDVSEHVVGALVATEDHRFYQHHGVDMHRLLGAVWYTLSGSRQGGSTITQQLARNLYPEEIGRSISLRRKLKELITAFKIEYAFEKDEILETYLNTVPFLFNAYGIEMAAKTYFGKSSSDLSAAESATLVGMLKGTAYYNPVRNPDRALERRNVVLRQMARRGYLEEDEAESLKERPLGLRFRLQEEPENPAPHFVEYLRDWLLEWADRNRYNIYRDSLVVHTTLDSRLQRHATAAVDRWMPSLQDVAGAEWAGSSAEPIHHSADTYRRDRRRHAAFDHFWNDRSSTVDAFIRSTPQYRRGIEEGVDQTTMIDSLRSDETFMDALREVKTRLSVGLVAMDPATGHVKAWVGSRDFDEDQFDHVARARRQPGSTFKPFVFAAALERGYRPDDTLIDEPISIRLAGGEVWEPQNAGGNFSESEVSLTDALVHSTNTIAVRLTEDVGARRVARLARRSGVQSSRLEEVPSLALGTSPVTLIEMVSGYATFASGGIFRDPVIVTRIEDKDGRVVYEANPRSRRVMREETAVTVVDMLRGVVDRGTGTRVRQAFGLTHDIAGKTGTTQNNADGWFVGMQPDLVAGTWIGFNDPRVTFRSSYWGSGGNNAALITGDFLRRATRDAALELGKQRFEDPPEPDAREGVFRRVTNWISGAFDTVIEWIGERIEALRDTEPDPIDRETPSTDDTPVRRVQADDDQAVADSLTRMERESRQLDRVLQELRQQRGGSEPEDQPPSEAPPPPDDAPEPEDDEEPDEDAM
jgi:penicillin-binding protein 1A